MFYPIKTIHPIGLPQVMLDVDDDELMQYTGLKDSNGQEIYEGDIITYKKPGHKEITQGVGYYNAHFIIADRLSKRHEDLWKALDLGDVMVIGNIYENPELIKTV